MTDEKIMLVVSITAGRNFPQHKDKQLIVEGRFNDEKLYSDPVAHLSAPQINTGKFCRWTTANHVNYINSQTFQNSRGSLIEKRSTIIRFSGHRLS